MKKKRREGRLRGTVWERREGVMKRGKSEQGNVRVCRSGEERGSERRKRLLRKEEKG